MSNTKKISLLIPVYNEVESLETLLERVESVDFCGLEKELVIVDDGSEDGTRDILRRLEDQHPQYRIIYHAQNMAHFAPRQLDARYKPVLGSVGMRNSRPA